MKFDQVLGQEFIKNHLQSAVQKGRVAHAQLFIGSSGYGVLPMAIAYARQLICNSSDKENKGCNLKFDQLSHPDLHFAFPVSTNTTIKRHPVSNNFLKEWREFLITNPYATLYEWHKKIEIEKKQGQIGVDESKDIVKKLSLKSYEGGTKVMIIWMAEKMNIEASNKLLKLIEEPPSNTVLILIAEDEEQILQTIKSRCQALRFPPIAEKVLVQYLVNTHNCTEENALKIAHQSTGDLNTALHILQDDGDEVQFETWFTSWVRTAFKAKGNKQSIIELIAWSEELAKQGREVQKKFLDYCQNFFRQALLYNYNSKELVYLQPKTRFQLEKFAPFIHGNNILGITKEIEDAAYLVERNGNAKIIFTDLSIKLTRLLHTKA